jgi:nitroreductase
MDFFEAIKKRRSIRRYTEKKVPQEIIEKALQAALLAPTSSNGQTWDFYWAVKDETKKKLVHYCLNQSAARTASDLIVVVASPSSWRRSQPELVKYVKEINAPKPVVLYYEKLFPTMYRWGFLNSIGYIKWISMFLIGLFRPITRGPATLRDIQEVCIKSAALAAENFVLAVSAQGYSTCMMEGFDEWRVKRLLKLKCSDRVVMVIAVGEEAERGTWGPQFRLKSDLFIHRI